MAEVAVTGATGHLGSSLVRQLIARGDRVRALVRCEDPEPLRGLELERVRGDVLQASTLEALIDGVDVLYHLAAQISIIGPMNGLVDAVNVEGVRNVVTVARRVGLPRLVHTCSVHVFEPEPLDEPTDEARSRVRRGQAPAYDVSKAEGEAVVREAVADGLDAVIVHPSAVMGPWDFGPSRMGHVLGMLYRRSLPALLSGGFDWVDARDVAASMIVAAERGRTNESYLLTGHYLTLGELAREAERVTGVRAPRLTSPAWLAQLGAPVMDMVSKVRKGEPLYTSESLMPLRLQVGYDRRKAGEELGHTVRPIDDTLRDAYAWMLATGRLPVKNEPSRALVDHAISAA